jgi:drug/metabolite transporter (DMT)-like permease
MLGMRFTVAGGLLLGWCLFRGERLPPARTFRQSAVTGILLLFVGLIAVAFAEQHLSTGLTAIIVAALPLWMVILDKGHWKESFTSIKVIAGLLLGFAGVVFLVTAGGDSVNFSIHNRAQLICLTGLMIGSISWAAGSLYSKHTPVPGSTFIKVSLQMLSAGVALLITSALIGDISHVSWQDVSRESWAGLLYLITFGSLVGYLCYIWVLGVWPASRVGTYAYVNPIVAVFLGWSLVGEPLSTGQFIGLGVILAGVMLVNSQSSKKK